MRFGVTEVNVIVEDAAVEVTLIGHTPRLRSPGTGRALASPPWREARRQADTRVTSAGSLRGKDRRVGAGGIDARQIPLADSSTPRGTAAFYLIWSIPW